MFSCYRVVCQLGYNTLSVTDLYVQRLILLFHNFGYHKDKLPEIFNNYFISNNEIHNNNTRSASSIHLPRVDTSYGKKSVSYAGVNLWNNLPEDLKNITSFSQFKAHLKLHSLHLQIKSYTDWLVTMHWLNNLHWFHYICISVLIWLRLVLLRITVLFSNIRFIDTCVNQSIWVYRCKCIMELLCYVFFFSFFSLFLVLC